MKFPGNILDIDNIDELIDEFRIAAKNDPNDFRVCGYLDMLLEMKKQDALEYSPKNPRRRKSLFNSPSAPARLRTLIGMDLVQFSQMCGIKYETYRAIERDTKKDAPPPNAIKDYQAELIALATGVCPNALMENRLVCADGETEYDYFIWLNYSLAIQHQHQQLELEWLNLFMESIREAIRFNPDDHLNGSFLKVVRLALQIDQFQEIYIRPTARGKPKRLISVILETTNGDIAQGAIKHSMRIKKMLRVTR